MAKFSIVTLGCEKNNVDSEGMGALLSDAGYEQSADPGDSDVVIVNTCAFLQAAVDESVGELRGLAENKREGQVLIAAGCMSQRYAEDVPAWVPGVDGVISTRSWPDIVPFVESIRRKSGPAMAAQAPMAATAPSYMPLEMMQAPGGITWAPVAPVQPTAQIRRFRRKAHGPSAYVKISEGCDHKCAFCIIPAIRGKHVSRPIPELVAEVRDLAEQGVQECILIAQDSTYYGRDLGLRDGLAQLLAATCTEVPEMRWLRLMYAYPTQVTPGLIETMARYPQICHYIDMPLQHGHPDTLRRMKRPNDMPRVRRLIADFRAAMPDIALRTTFIAGFPGETEDEFKALLDFIQEIEFDHVGVFTYSPEEGTVAATLAAPVPEKIKQR